jgi:hypothetical protein
MGTASERSALAGEWEGEYSSAVTGREGTIRFNLTEAADTARGEVWMIGRRVANRVYRPDNMPYVEIERQVESLTIAFVRMEGDDLVTGLLDPYLDPDSGLEVVTVFRGRVDGNVISGEYATTIQRTGEVSTGRWRVERRIGKAVDQRR